MVQDESIRPQKTTNIKQIIEIYIKNIQTDAIMTLSLTREQLENLKSGNSCLVLLPQDQHAPITQNEFMSQNDNYQT